MESSKKADETIRIAIDTMSGDSGLETVCEACRIALNQFKDICFSNIQLNLIGDADKIENELSRLKLKEHPQIIVTMATEVITMTDAPATVLRRKLDSSMRVAINAVKEGKADACVSAGNTGALMALSRLLLKMLPGIDRPAICTVVPNIHGHVHWLDLGANIDCDENQLYQFALMGSALCNIVDSIENPKVGLLNIGSEDIKGSEVIKKASKMLEDSNLNYIGFVEGDDIYCGKQADVIVCDGFSGNIALKTSEGLVKFVKNLLKSELKSSLLKRIVAFLIYPVLKSIGKKIDPSMYNGASLLGLNGIVIKSHGSANAKGFANAILIAGLEARKQLPKKN